MECGSDQVLETNLDEPLIETEAKRKNLNFDPVNQFSIYYVRLKEIKPKDLVLFLDEDNEESINSHKIYF